MGHPTKAFYKKQISNFLDWKTHQRIKKIIEWHFAAMMKAVALNISQSGRFSFLTPPSVPPDPDT